MAALHFNLLLARPIVAVGLAFYLPSAVAGSPVQSYPKSEWGPLKELLNADVTLLPSNWRGAIKLPHPPKGEGLFAEIRYLKKMAVKRDLLKNEIKEQDKDFVPYFREALAVSGKFSRNTEALINLVARDATIAVVYWKNKFNRSRPWHVDPSLGHSIPKPRHPSYPSGHATQSMVIALALSDALEKDCSSGLIITANEIGQNREIAGVHFPSDTAAGQELARQLHQLMLRSAAYKEAVVAAKAELKSFTRCRENHN